MLVLWNRPPIFAAPALTGALRLCGYEWEGLRSGELLLGMW